MPTYTSSQVAKLFSCSAETIRQRFIEFENHFSPKSRSGAGLKRNFDETDLSIFALIHEMKAAGKLYTDIHAALDNGARGTIPATNTLTPPPASRLATLEREIEQYRAALTEAKANENKLTGQVELLQRMIADKDSEIARLNRELGSRK